MHARIAAMRTAAAPRLQAAVAEVVNAVLSTGAPSEDSVDG
jgi:hypothetical protein